jgi:hypothetical protein
MTSTPRLCHHCGSSADDSPYRVVLQGMSDDHSLPLCRSCQSLRQGGQLPVDLLVQQWTYEHSGPRAGHSGEPDEIVVRLECLGCGDPLAPLDGAASPGGVPASEVRRLPDGSLTTECAACQRTNLLQRRGRQMVAVRLW